jgi:putative glycosyltransferase (TIGR04348 family)
MAGMNEPPVVIISPALASSNNGNWHTAARWREFLSTQAQTTILQRWNGEDAIAMVALHARRSADSIARFRKEHPTRPLALVLTGTDLYGDLASDAAIQHSLQCASHIVVLQQEALCMLSAADQARARVIVQSAPRVSCVEPAAYSCDFVAVGHLRSEKDPLTLMLAARHLRGTGIRIVHIGNALDAVLGVEAQKTMEDCPDYRWLGGLPQSVARQWMACARALVHMSRLEGGANVVIEAVRAQVPVLASRIDGNVGLLGRDYDGYFEVGNTSALAGLMRRAHEAPSWLSHLKAQCAKREPLFDTAAEAMAVQRLLGDLLNHQGGDNR